MNWLGFLIPSVVILLPLLALLLPKRRNSAAPVSARLSALTLYRHQLRDLDRDRESGLLDDGELSRAELEIQRRILAADRLEESPLKTQPRQSLRFAVLLAALPCFGFALYLANGHPSLPAQPHRATPIAVPPAMQALFAKLDRQVAGMTPDDPDYVRQSVLLGQVDEALNRPDDALRAYRKALSARFIPELAVQIAELQTQQDGHISADSLALYRKALDAAPADAPWRLAVEARIAAGEHDQSP
ncbi:c-type cytochrome biogenesis protein CcmI [Asaia sp. HN010]|uniref:c-type cytochrome biogenesis protein CcmI n=1 Tax=Asaia sp. HN010 TaxID=3081233 RepID=UPI00301A070F